ncbi:hypothetical protein CSB11_01455 [Candidatus Campbellbacteria bacterium]|nr:MAG: hypothetical protein CSB11_01455 [Candidatus Campbellbacteria bacterium]
MKKKIIQLIILFFIIIIIIIVVTKSQKTNITNQDNIIQESDKNFWSKNNCFRPVPESFVIKNKFLKDYSVSLNKEKGYLLEKFVLNDKKFEVIQYGCNSFIIKFLVPIDESQVVKEINNNFLHFVVDELDEVKKVYKDDFIKIISNILLEKKDLVKFNHVVYSTCGGELCNNYIVLSEIKKIGNEYYVPVKFVQDY